jgi:hypothetical protein
MRMKTIVELGNFVRHMRIHLKYGELSRAPLGLLRIEVRDDRAECDWMARRPDVFDSSLPQNRGSQLESEQALRDAMAIGQLLFEALPDVHEADLRAFRQSAREPPDLIIIGTLRREVPPVLRVPSLAMRAKLYGFHFWLDDGVLLPLEAEREQHSLRSLSSFLGKVTQQGSRRE